MKAIRWLAPALLLGTASLGTAQTLTSAEAQALMNKVWSDFRADEQILFHVVGSETTGSARPVPLEVRGFFRTAMVGERRNAWLEMYVMRAGFVEEQYVADGATFWAYNARRNEYSARRYAGYDGSVPEDAVRRLLTLADSRASGLAPHVTRILRETWAASTPQHRSWIPGSSATRTTDGLVYDSGSPLMRTAAFSWTESAEGVATFTGARGSDVRNVGRSVRTTAWEMSLYRDPVSLEGATYQFVPPVGAKPLVG